MEQYNVTGMSCAACSARVEKAVSKVEGVTSCSVSLLTNSMGVEGTASPDAIIDAVTKAGYGASLKGGDMTQNAAPDKSALEDHDTPVLKKRLIASVGFLAVLMYISMGHMMWNWPLPSFFNGNHIAMGLVQMLLTIIIMVINRKFFVSGFQSLLRRSPNMDTLVALGVRGDGQVLEALEGVANDYTLWAPQIARWNPDRIPSSYAVFYGAPEKDTREEEMYLQKVRRALRLGKIPGVATGKSPRERVNGLSPLVRAAELIHQGGYGKQEAIRAVTENNAFLLGLSQRTGCLKTGMEADVNVVPYEALEDLRQLQNLCMTARGGRLIWSHMKAMERIRFCVAAPGCE